MKYYICVFSSANSQSAVYNISVNMPNTDDMLGYEVCVCLFVFLFVHSFVYGWFSVYNLFQVSQVGTFLLGLKSPLFALLFIFAILLPFCKDVHFRIPGVIL